eukprot:343360-Rhodomonas_salina.2
MKVNGCPKLENTEYPGTGGRARPGGTSAPRLRLPLSLRLRGSGPLGSLPPSESLRVPPSGSLPCPSLALSLRPEPPAAPEPQAERWIPSGPPSLPPSPYPSLSLSRGLRLPPRLRAAAAGPPSLPPLPSCRDPAGPGLPRARARTHTQTETTTNLFSAKGGKWRCRVGEERREKSATVEWERGERGEGRGECSKEGEERARPWRRGEDQREA